MDQLKELDKLNDSQLEEYTFQIAREQCKRKDRDCERTLQDARDKWFELAKKLCNPTDHKFDIRDALESAALQVPDQMVWIQYETEEINPHEYDLECSNDYGCCYMTGQSEGYDGSAYMSALDPDNCRYCNVCFELKNDTFRIKEKVLEQAIREFRK